MYVAGVRRAGSRAEARGSLHRQRARAARRPAVREGRRAHGRRAGIGNPLFCQAAGALVLRGLHSDPYSCCCCRLRRAAARFASVTGRANCRRRPAIEGRYVEPITEATARFSCVRAAPCSLSALLMLVMPEITPPSDQLAENMQAMCVCVSCMIRVGQSQLIRRFRGRSCRLWRCVTRPDGPGPHSPTRLRGNQSAP